MTTPSLSKAHSHRPSLPETPRHPVSPAAEPEKPAPVPTIDDQFESSGRPEPSASTEPAPQKPNFIQAFFTRISQFYKDLTKAFTRFFKKEEPKSELDVQLKYLKHNLQRTLNDKALEQTLKETAEKVELLAPEDRQMFEPLVSAAKSESGRKQWVAENLHKPLSQLLKVTNQNLANPENQEEVRQSIIALPALLGELPRILLAGEADATSQSPKVFDGPLTQDDLELANQKLSALLVGKKTAPNSISASGSHTPHSLKAISLLSGQDVLDAVSEKLLAEEDKAKPTVQASTRAANSSRKGGDATPGASTNGNWFLYLATLGLLGNKTQAKPEEKVS